MKSKQEIAADSVSQIRQLLADWLIASAEAREPVAEILKLLEPLDAYIRGELNHPPSSQKKPQDGGSSRGGRTTYTVTKQKNEVEMLTEHREGGSSQPYRVPRPIYDATVSVLSDADSPLDFNEVLKAVAVVRPDPPEWQVRAVLRFLLNAQPPLIFRERSKYRSENPKKLSTEAKQLWQSVAKASK
jgi:hypothetical protein